MRKVDLFELAAHSRFTKFHAAVLGWCCLIVVFDGYDLAVSGIALPAMMRDLRVDATQAGLMVSAALFGAMCGAVIMGTLADKIGRRRAIALCVAIFSLFTAVAGLAQSPVFFSAARFMAGLGIGGVMPAVVAHMTEYSPRRMRATLVTLMFSGYSIGGIVAALLGKLLIEAKGWQAVFFVAATPIVIIPLLLKSLPESLSHLLARRRYTELRAIASHLGGGHVFDSHDEFVTEGTPGSAQAGFRALFDEGRTQSTLMFWIAFFMCLFMVYALSSWLTKLMAGAGYGFNSALTFVLVLNAGGVLGAVGGGMLADRFSAKRVLVCMFALAAVTIALLGSKPPAASLYLLLCAAGASTIGTQIVVYAYAGQYYPMPIRSTGIGWASGVGRGGAISAPVIIGSVVALALPLQQNFVLMAIPALIAMVAVMFIDRRAGRAQMVRHESVDEDLPGDAGLAVTSAATENGRNGS
jgi:AAHS family benzoate transporter-like MFS transporter